MANMNYTILNFDGPKGASFETAIQSLVNKLDNGEVVGISTEAGLYALAVKALDIDARKKFGDVKGIAKVGLISVTVPNGDVERYFKVPAVITSKLPELLQQGPLNLIFESGNTLSHLNPGSDIDVCGITRCIFMQRLVARLQSPLALSAAEVTEGQHVCTPEKVFQAYPNLSFVIADTCENGLDSTVVDLSKKDCFIAMEKGSTYDKVADILHQARLRIHPYRPRRTGHARFLFQ